MKAKIKLLTFGMVTMRKERLRDVDYWKESAFEYSEKQDAVFYEIEGIPFCSFVENGIPKIERIGKKSFPESGHFKVVQINIEDMRFRVLNMTYNKNRNELNKAWEDAKMGKLTSLFLSDDIIFFKN